MPRVDGFIDSHRRDGGEGGAQGNTPLPSEGLSLLSPVTLHLPRAPALSLNAGVG